MAPTIWGLNLGEIHPRKFASSYMWNKVYHLRRTKFIVYQLAMILCVISESVGTAALSDYRDQSKDIKRLGLGDGAGEWSGDWIGVASYNIFNGIYVAFIFGAAFFFDLIWPERREDRGIRNAYKWTAISTIFTTLASAIAMTVIFATHRSAIRGTPEQAAAIDRYIAENGKDPLNYMDNTLIKVSIAFIWPGFLACIASTIVLWKSDAYIERNGPWTRSELVARLAQTPGTPPYSPSETNLVGSSVPGSPGYNWHDEKLKDPKRGGGPTVSPVAGSNGTGKKVEAAEVREGKEIV